MKSSLSMLLLCSLLSCSTSKPDTKSETDSSSIAAKQATEIGPLSVLDIDNIKAYNATDTSVNFPQHRDATDSAAELNNLKTDSRVSRTGRGLRFQLSDGNAKLLKENKTTGGDDFNAFTFLRAMDDIGQWLVLGSYYESMDYVLVDQHDGTETHLWGYPTLSPDKNHFLTSMVDLEAGFVPNGFQLWSVEDKKPVLMYEQELTDWGFDHVIWTQDNKIVAQQTYRDGPSGELKTRVIKMRFVEGLE